MSIRIVCPSCESMFHVSDAQAGKQVKCRNCGKPFKAHPLGKGRTVTEEEEQGDIGDDVPRSKPGRATKETLDDRDEGRLRRRNEEDDRPRRQRGDDEEDQPRRRKRLESRDGPNVGLIVGLSVGGLVLLVGIGVGLFFLLGAGDDPDIVVIRQRHGDKVAELIIKARQENPEGAKLVIDFLKDETMPALKGLNIDDNFFAAGGGFGRLKVQRPIPNLVNPNPIKPFFLDPNPEPNPNPKPPLPHDFAPDQEVRTAAEALDWLKTGDVNKQNRAIHFLLRANPNVPERPQIAQLLNGLQVVKGIYDSDLALIKWATSAEVPTLVKFAEDPEFSFRGKERRHKALERLGEMQDPRGLDVTVEKLGASYDRMAAQTAMSLYGEKARPALIKHFFHKNAETRNEVHNFARKLNIPAEEILPSALEALNHEDVGVRTAAAAWFGQTPAIPKFQEQVATALVHLLDVKETRLAALRGLENWATKASVPALVRMVQGNNTPKREAMKALARFKDEEGAKVIASQITSFSERGNALEMLKEMGKEAAYKALLPYMNHEDVWVHSKVRQQLQEWGVPNAELINQSLKDLQAAEQRKKEMALQFLGKEPPEDKMRSEVLKNIQPFLNDTHRGVQGAAYVAYFNWTGKEAAPQLILLVTGENSPKRHEAMSALARFKEVPQAAPAIASRLPNFIDRGHAAKLLKSMGPTAEPAVQPYLFHRDGNVRIEACHILKEIGVSADTLKALQRLSNPKDPRQTQAALEAYQAIQVRMKQNSQPKEGDPKNSDPKGDGQGGGAEGK